MLAATIGNPAWADAQGIRGGLFGTTTADGTPRDRLEVLATLSEGYDSELPPELTGRLVGNDSPFGGLSSSLLVTANYARHRRLFNVSGTATSHFNYYPRLERVDAFRHNVTLEAGFSLPGRGKLTVGQTAAYSPSYLYELLPTAALTTPGAVAPGALEFRIDLADSYSYRTNAGVSYGSERGTRLTADGHYVRTDFESPRAVRPRRERYGLDSKLARSVSRNLKVSAGYSFLTGDFALDGEVKEHRAPLGLEYSTALTPSRRLAFRVEVAPVLFDVLSDGVERQRTSLQGALSLDYPFHLKWRASAGYRRGTHYIAILDEPVVTDGADVKLNGLIGRRLDVSAAARYAAATSALGSSGRPLDTYSGEVRGQYALSRNLAVFSEYTYYYFDLGEQTGFVADLPRIYRQHSIRAGVTFFAHAGR